jgi:hypothetical protein
MPVPSMIIQDQWRIVTQTSNMFGAGTDAPVFVQVIDKTHHLLSNDPPGDTLSRASTKEAGGVTGLDLHSCEVPSLKPQLKCC